MPRHAASLLFILATVPAIAGPPSLDALKQAAAGVGNRQFTETRGFIAKRLAWSANRQRELTSPAP